MQMLPGLKRHQLVVLIFPEVLPHSVVIVQVLFLS